MSHANALPQALAQAVETIRPFVPKSQLHVMLLGLGSEEGDHYAEKIYALAETITGMPKTYEQEGAGDAAVVHLHYFIGSCDWWITEKDMEGLGNVQAFGLARMQVAELGYICIHELLTVKGMQLDLHWAPVTLATVWASIGKAAV